MNRFGVWGRIVNETKHLTPAAARRAIKRAPRPPPRRAPCKDPMTAPQGIWFVYRSHREGPLGKRVRRIAAPSILAWFQAKIEEARTSLTPHRVAEADLGGPVHGLAALFEAAKQHSLHTPKSTAALSKMLLDHLHSGGHVDDVRVDAHAVRVLAGDEDGEVAWFFFDDEAQGRLPRNLAYLLHDEPRLPDGAAERLFAAAAVPALAPAGEGEGETYACLMTSHGRRTLAGRAVVIPGVRLPELAAHLRRVTPGQDVGAPGHDGWPIELRVLRAMIDADDTKLEPALRRAAAYPLEAVMQKGETATLAAGPHEAARAELGAAAEGLAHGGDAARSIVFEGEHAALLAVHVSERAGFDQWILFDDRWAAASSDLATSILHAAEHADPFAPLRPTRAPAKAAAKPKTEKAPAKPKAEKAARKTKAAEASKATKDEQAWKAAIGDRDVAAALGYRPNVRFDKGGLVAHAKFGIGVVTRIESTKCEVLFRDGPRLLVHGG